MERISQRAPQRNTLECPPDLFAWSRERDLWQHPGARRIARRFGLTIATAATIAMAAGLDCEGTRR